MNDDDDAVNVPIAIICKCLDFNFLWRAGASEMACFSGSELESLLKSALSESMLLVDFSFNPGAGAMTSEEAMIRMFIGSLIEGQLIRYKHEVMDRN